MATCNPIVGRVIGLCAALIPVGVPVQAADADAVQALSSAMVRFGLTGVSTLARSQRSLPPARTSFEQQSAALTKALQNYRSGADIRSQVEMERGSMTLFIDVTAAGVGMTVVGTVPAVLMAGAAQAGSDLFFGQEEKKLNAEMANLLASKFDELLRATGASYDQLHGKSLEDLKKILTQTPQVINLFKEMFPGDERVRQMAQELMSGAILNNSIESLNLIKANTEQIKGAQARVVAIANDLSAFEKHTESVLKQHQQAIKGVQLAVIDLQDSVKSLDARLKHQEINTAIVADFAFSRMSSEEKAASLKAGFLQERFACQDGSTNCENAKLKFDLIKKYESEAKLDAAVVTVRGTVAAMSNVSTIAKNLHIDVPGLDVAVQYGNIASQAFSAAASGNFLGAITAVSGIFGSHVDPAAERHAELMRYLGLEFGEIRASLKEILANQQKLMTMIVALSEQLAAYYDALDERLANMEFELKTVTKAAQRAAWERWESCYSIYFGVKTKAAQFDFENGDFKTAQGIERVWRENRPSLQECFPVAQSRSVAITAPQWFGNQLDMAFAAQATTDVDVGGADKEKYHPKLEIRSYIEDVYEPVLTTTTAFLAGRKIPLSRGFQLLAAPSASVDDLQAKLTLPLAAMPNGDVVPCGVNGFLDKTRLSDLLCASGDANEVAALLLQQPMVTDHVVAIADWMLMLTRIFDVMDPISNNPVPANEIGKAFSDGRFVSGQVGPGRDIIWKTMLLADASIASYTMTYGDIGATAVLTGLRSGVSLPAGPNVPFKAVCLIACRLSDPADVCEKRCSGSSSDASLKNDPFLRPFKDTPLTAKLRKTLAKNGYLSRNVAMVLLRQRYGDYRVDGSYTKSRPNFFSYKTALDYASQPHEDRYVFLRALFGDMDFDFDASKEAVVFTLLSAENVTEKIKVAMPLPEQFLQGRLTYPSRLLRLVQARDRLAERLLDYDLPGTLADADRLALTDALTRAARTTAQ